MAPKISVTRSFPVPLIIVILIISFHLLFPSCSPSLNPPPLLSFFFPSLHTPISHYPYLLLSSPPTHTHSLTIDVPFVFLCILCSFCVMCCNYVLCGVLEQLVSDTHVCPMFCTLFVLSCRAISVDLPAVPDGNSTFSVG